MALVAFLPMWLQAQTISVAISVKEPTCFSWTDGGATATPTGGTAPYSYAWSNGQVGTHPTLSGISAGNYSVTVTDAVNVLAIQTFVVGQPTAIVPAINVTGGTTCDASSSYVGSATGGTTPYTYVWRNLTSNVITNGQTLATPAIGSYQLTVTDANGCTAPKVVDVRPLKVMVIAKDATCGGACDGTAEGWVDGGSPPYTYRWSTGATTGIVFPLPGGSYTVTVTDANGCVKVATGSVFEPPVLKPNLTVVGTCSGAATATVAPTGGRTPLIIRWSNGGITNTITNLSQGLYSVTISDSAGCKKDTLFRVSTGVLGLTISKTEPNCTTGTLGSAKVNVTGGSMGPYSYLWNNGATTDSISNLTVGTYTVTVTDGAGCTSSQSIILQSTSNVVLQKTSTNSTCSGATGTASITSVTGGVAPYTYLWTNGATTSSISNLAVGEYKVTVTDASGCSSRETFTILGQGNLSILVASSPSSCGATTGTASVTNVAGGTAPYTYLWNNGATTASISNLGVAPYYVTVTDATGCSSSRLVQVEGISAIQVNVVNTKTDCGASNGTATVTGATGGTAPYTYLWSTGATTATVTGLASGSYNVVVTDATGCSKSATVVVNDNSNLVLATGTTPSVCGAATGTASVSSVTGGTAPYTYTWHNGGSTANISGLAAGSYFVTVTDATGCRRTSTVEVLATSNFTLSTTATNSTCNASVGTATVAATGGNAPYTYRWSNGGLTSTISNLPGGNYTVTVTDNLGCSNTKSVQVDAPTTVFTINSTATISSCTSPTGSATVTSVTGGNPPYTYKWSNNQVTAGISNVASGTYTVTVTDGSGCSQTKEIVVSPSVPITAQLNATATACGLSTGSILTTTIIGGTAPYAYLWSNGATTSSISNLGGGVYTATITDAAGCTINASAMVRAIANFDISTSSTNSGCLASTGSATVVNVTGGVAPYTYKWSNGATTQNISNIPSGIYTVTVLDSRNCETVSSSVIVNSTAALTITPSVSNATCGKTNGQISLTTTGGTGTYTYKWSDLTGSGQTASRTDLAAGTYSVEITDATGCSSFLSNLKIIDTGSVKAQAAIQPQGCVSNGDSVIMRLTNNTTAQSANVTYSWWFTGNRTSTLTSPEPVYGTLNGEARLIARSAEGCVDTLSLQFPVDVIKVASTPNPAATCLNTPLNITLTNQNPNFTPTYKWANGDLTASTTVTPTVGGYAQHYVTITNTYGCTKQDSVTVNAVTNLAAADLSWKQGCEPFSVSLFNTNANANQWDWNFGDPDNPTAGSIAANPTYRYSKAGNFTVTLTPRTLACLNSLTMPVTVSDKFAVTVNAGRDTNVCSSDRVTLKALSSANNYEWSNSPIFTTILGTGATLPITPNSGANTYFVRSKDALSLGCTAIDTVVVNNQMIRIDRMGTVDVCGNADKTLNVINLQPTVPLSVTWAPTSIIIGFLNNDSLRPIVRTKTDATLIGTFKNQYGCTLVDNVVIKARLLDATVSASSKSLYANETAILSATPTGTGYTYSWSSPATLTNPNAAITTALPKDNTTYIVTVTDAFGCQDTAQVTLRVMVPQCEEPYIFIPRAFTPNGDGTNDLCYVRGEYLTTLEFVIFNRWGEQVFVTKDKTIGWDGTHKGQPVCPDVYGYYVKGTCQKGEQFFKKGNITVLK